MANSRLLLSHDRDPRLTPVIQRDTRDQLGRLQERCRWTDDILPLRPGSIVARSPGLGVFHIPSFVKVAVSVDQLSPSWPPVTLAVFIGSIGSTRNYADHSTTFILSQNF